MDPIVLHFMIFMSGRLPLFGNDVDLERELEHDGHVELVGGSKHLLVQGVDVGLFAAALEFLRQPRHGSRDAFTVLTELNVALSVFSGDLEVSQSVGVVPHDNLWPVVLRIAEEPASSSRGAQDATLTLRLTMARRRRQLLHH